jgi:hypothetical protein
VPRREPYLPKHRAAVPERQPLRKGLRTTLTLGGIAVTATGLAVAPGVVRSGDRSGATSAPVASAPVASAPVASAPVSVPEPQPVVRRSAVDLGSRARVVSRSDQRTTVDATKRKALDQRSGGQVVQTEDLTSRDPRTIARAMLPAFGFGTDQFGCLDSLYNRESGWNVHADNPSSSAYGIPQSLPGSKMASAGSDWADDAATQIRWGLGYIKGRYGTPCGAWGHSESHGWY